MSVNAAVGGRLVVHIASLAIAIGGVILLAGALDLAFAQGSPFGTPPPPSVPPPAGGGLSVDEAFRRRLIVIDGAAGVGLALLRAALMP